MVFPETTRQRGSKNIKIDKIRSMSWPNLHLKMETASKQSLSYVEDSF